MWFVVRDIPEAHRVAQQNTFSSTPIWGGASPKCSKSPKKRELMSGYFGPPAPQRFSPNRPPAPSAPQATARRLRGEPTFSKLLPPSTLWKPSASLSSRGGGSVWFGAAFRLRGSGQGRFLLLVCCFVYFRCWGYCFLVVAGCVFFASRERDQPRGWPDASGMSHQRLSRNPGPRPDPRRFVSSPHTVDGRNPFRTIQETLECVESPVNTNKQCFPMVSKWCEMDFVHPQ